jgi:pseudaminic acid biosynthesis-associated methylase
MNQRLEDLWRGEFGDQYHARHEDERDKIIERNTAFFDHIYTDVIPGFIDNVLEFGSGTGLNLQAWAEVVGFEEGDEGDLAGVEINAGACAVMREHGFTVHEQSFLDEPAWDTYDLVFTKGVLIHLDEDDLLAAYKALYEATCKCILICEYFAPQREMIFYRDQSGICYRDDYAAGLWAAYPDLKFLGSGFAWAKDPEAGQDNLTWFLFERVMTDDEPEIGDDDQG